MRNPQWLSVAFLLIAALSSPAEKVATMPAPTGYIDDYAGVLTTSGKTELEELCRRLHDQTRAQLFVVTIKSLDGDSIDDFSNNLFAKWKIGEKKTDRGVLILLAIKDHKRRIAVGNGLQGIITDATAGDIGREMVPNLRASDYDGAVRTGVRRVSEIIATDAKVDFDESPSPETLAALENQQTAAPPVEKPLITASPRKSLAIVGFFFLSIIGGFAFFAWRIKKGLSQGFKPGHPGSSGSSSSFGSSGGGTSLDDSFSSSDDTFGGGDGGFSDGGGASGDW